MNKNFGVGVNIETKSTDFDFFSKCVIKVYQRFFLLFKHLSGCKFWIYWDWIEIQNAIFYKIVQILCFYQPSIDEYIKNLHDETPHFEKKNMWASPDGNLIGGRGINLQTFTQWTFITTNNIWLCEIRRVRIVFRLFKNNITPERLIYYVICSFCFISYIRIIDS